MTTDHRQIAMRVSKNTIIGNVLLSAFKLAAGILGHSGAMISDAVHSLSDVLSTVIVMIGVRLAGRESDRDHPYGHERMECVAAVLLAGMLFATGLGIGWVGVRTLIAGRFDALAMPGRLALIAAVLSIAVKEGMYHYTKAAARRIGSGAMMADAWHHRSDALSSVGSFVGILGARLGVPALDPVASVVICLFILKASYDIFRDAVGRMTDKSCDDDVSDEIRTVILSHDDVICIDEVRTRMFGNRIYVDVEICLDGAMTIEAGHDIAHRVHDAVEEKIPMVKHCMVHVNPHAGMAET